MYDINKIRQDFPILSRRVNDVPLVYLDSGASAQKPKIVLQKIEDIYKNHYANIHRGLHFLSNEATLLYEEARTKVQKFLNAQRDHEIIFTKNATEAINLVSYSWGFDNLTRDDEIILTVMEHHANIIPWHFLREKLGVKLIFANVDENGNLLLDDIKKLVTNKTKLIAFTHMSNVLGTITPVKDICAYAKSKNIATLVDGSQAVVHMSVDVTEINCDWYVFTGHKLYGPTGIGVLYAKEDKLKQMRPFLGGGDMVDIVSQTHVTYNKLPHKFEAGTPPFVEAIALATAIDYLSELSYDAIMKHETEITNYAYNKLSQLENINFLGRATNKGSIIAFNINNIHAQDLAMFLDKYGVAIRAGNHCAQPLLSFFNISSVCRASFGLYTNHNDIDHFVNSLNKIKGFF
ncbi:aminotransferase class V-fold PLP-dependent enzyme [Bartonella sp. DGB1]|uniref:aminotransferase class V-fold PLP-dependent enzyme n=1 Tax=Bartonella sp. DGB1 TaxID=3239807 RepID=UPI003524472F